MKSNILRYSVLFLALSLTIFSCINKPNDLNVFAASGTMLPVEEISNFYLIPTSINFGASGILARQIYSGAEADVFISANKQWIDFLIEKEIIESDNYLELAKNRLVLICPISNSIIKEIGLDKILASADKLAIGDPRYVPAGKYAKQVLESLNLYNSLQNKTILTKDVNSVLNYVELNECDIGIVYYSEAIKSNKVKIISEIPQEHYDEIRFYIAKLNNKKETVDYYNFMLEEKSFETFIKYGFL